MFKRTCSGIILSAFFVFSHPAFAAGTGEICGGIAGVKCDSNLWCEPDAGQCGTADAQGKCVAIPDVCTLDFRPVCGCDDKTYSNDCRRRQAKVGKKADGECK